MLFSFLFTYIFNRYLGIGGNSNLYIDSIFFISSGIPYFVLYKVYRKSPNKDLMREEIKVAIGFAIGLMAVVSIYFEIFYIDEKGLFNGVSSFAFMFNIIILSGIAYHELESKVSNAEGF
jgi:Trk-type K+ transport system membrane component